MADISGSLGRGARAATMTDRMIWSKAGAATFGNANILARKAGREIRNVKGKVSANYRYARIRNSMKAFYKIEETLETKGKDHLITMMKIAKQLEGFDAKMFSKLHNKLMGNEPKLIEQAHELINMYVTDIGTFERSFGQVMELLEGAVVQADEMEKSILDDIRQTLKEAVALANKQKLVIPKEVTDKVKSKIKALSDRQIRIHNRGINRMQKDAKSLFNESKGKRVAGAIGTVTGLGWVFMKARSRLNTFGKKGTERLIKVQNAIKEQIENKEVKINFLSLVLEYLDNLKFIDILSDKFREDINRIHETIFQSFFEMRSSVAQFMAIFQQDEGMQDLQKRMVELDESTAYLTNSIKNDIRSDVDLIKAIVDFKESASSSLEYIGAFGKATLKSLEDKREAGGWIRAHTFDGVTKSATEKLRDER